MALWYLRLVRLFSLKANSLKPVTKHQGLLVTWSGWRRLRLSNHTPRGGGGGAVIGGSELSCRTSASETAVHCVFHPPSGHLFCNQNLVFYFYTSERKSLMHSSQQPQCLWIPRCAFPSVRSILFVEPPLAHQCNQCFCVLCVRTTVQSVLHLPASYMHEYIYTCIYLYILYNNIYIYICAHD